MISHDDRSRHRTAADVLAGADRTGGTAVVAGGYSGVGLASTRALAEAGAHVVVPARRPGQARRALAGVERVEVDELDLADLASVRDFAERFRSGHATLDILIA